jgi:hypothetical protein
MAGLKTGHYTGLLLTGKVSDEGYGRFIGFDLGCGLRGGVGACADG